MNRIIGFLVMALAITALADPAATQQARKMPRIGFLLKASVIQHKPVVDAFRRGLRDLGYVEGSSIEIIYRSAEGRPQRFPSLVAELLDEKVAVIVILGGDPVRAAMRATATVPIVLTVGADYVATGLVASLRRPGGNVTGLSNLSQDLMGKQLQLLKETVPALARVAIIGLDHRSHAENVKQAKAAAPALGLELVVIHVAGGADLPGAFRRMKTERVDGIVVLRSGFLVRLRGQIVKLAGAARLPTMFGHVREVAAGGLMAYGADTLALFRGAAAYVDKILKGANPAEMPVSQATKFILTVNLATAKTLGITFPSSILLRADKVIE